MTGRLLLVEDNPSDEKLTLRAFRKWVDPSSIVVVRDGAEALAHLHATGPYTVNTTTQPHLVLLDLKLPRVDGIEVVRRMRADERTALTPVVVLTASGEDEDVSRAYAAGANAYVRKPVDFAEFVEVARILAVFWLQINEAAPLRRSMT